MDNLNSIMEENKYLVHENKYLRKLVADLEEERKIYCINKKVDSYQNDYVNTKALIKENKHLKKMCSKLEYERNYYIFDSSIEESLFEKYTGFYNKDENTLIVNYSVDDKNIYPYRCYKFDGYTDVTSVSGSWDNWNKDYTLYNKCVRDSDGIYEGYIYYIVVENIIPGNEYEFKFKDSDSNWIEPVYEGETIDDAGCNITLKQNSSGSWNAVIKVLDVISDVN